MQLVGIALTVVLLVAGWSFYQEIVEYEARKARIRRQQALFRRSHPTTAPRELRTFSTRLYDQDAPN